MTGNTILTRNIRILSWVSLFTDLASEMLYPVMPIFLLSIGYSVPGIGLLEGFAEATAGLGKGFFGSLSDHTQRRLPFVQVGYTISALSKPLMALLPGVAWVFGCRTADRLGKGIRTSARDALLADECSPENRAKVFGFHRAMDTTGAVIGPLLALGSLYLFPGNYSLLFIIAFLPGILAIMFTFFIKSNPPKPFIHKPFKPFAFLGYFKIAQVNYKKTVIILLLFSLLNSSDMFLLMQLKNHGASDVQSIWVYIFYNTVYAITAYPIGKLAGKLGTKSTLVAGMCIFAIAYCGIAWAGSLLVVVLFFGLYGIFAASTDGISKAMISTMCKKEETATALGFFNGAQSLISLFAGALTGFLWWQFGPAFALGFSGLGALVVAGILSLNITKTVI